MTLDSPSRRRFRDAAERRYSDDADFTARFNALLPLFGLRWVLLLLNEFLPERWQVRVNAGGNKSNDWTQAKMRQLARAESLLESVSNELEVAAHGKF